MANFDKSSAVYIIYDPIMPLNYFTIFQEIKSTLKEKYKTLIFSEDLNFLEITNDFLNKLMRESGIENVNLYLSNKRFYVIANINSFKKEYQFVSEVIDFSKMSYLYGLDLSNPTVVDIPYAPSMMDLSSEYDNNVGNTMYQFQNLSNESPIKSMYLVDNFESNEIDAKLPKISHHPSKPSHVKTMSHSTKPTTHLKTPSHHQNPVSHPTVSKKNVVHTNSKEQPKQPVHSTKDLQKSQQLQHNQKLQQNNQIHQQQLQQNNQIHQQQLQQQQQNNQQQLQNQRFQNNQQQQQNNQQQNNQQQQQNNQQQQQQNNQQQNNPDRVDRDVYPRFRVREIATEYPIPKKYPWFVRDTAIPTTLFPLLPLTLTVKWNDIVTGSSLYNYYSFDEDANVWTLHPEIIETVNNSIKSSVSNIGCTTKSEQKFLQLRTNRKTMGYVLQNEEIDRKSLSMEDHFEITDMDEMGEYMVNVLDPELVHYMKTHGQFSYDHLICDDDLVDQRLPEYVLDHIRKEGKTKRQLTKTLRKKKDEDDSCITS